MNTLDGCNCCLATTLPVMSSVTLAGNAGKNPELIGQRATHNTNPHTNVKKKKKE